MADRWVAAHKSPAGPGDARPTAKQIVEAEELNGQWYGRNIFITGCSSGLGVEAAKALADTGATLFLTARNISKAEEALGDLAKSPNVHLLKLDLNSLADVRRCSKDFLSRIHKLDVLICNAGVMYCPEGRTEEGFETHFGTNHLAHFLLVQLLHPALKAAATTGHNSRVVILSSSGHRFGSVNFDDLNFESGYDATKAYSQSKTANVWTVHAYDRRAWADGVRAWAVQPGMIHTGLMQHMDEKALQALKEHPYLKQLMKSAEQGAATEVWAACSKALEGDGGKYVEDCQLIRQWQEGDDLYGPGYAAHATDQQGQEKLYELSMRLVGLA